MAAYRRVYDSRHLQELGSDPEPYAQQSSMGCLYLLRIWRLRVARVHICTDEAQWVEGRAWRIDSFMTSFTINAATCHTSANPKIDRRVIQSCRTTDRQQLAVVSIHTSVHTSRVV